MRGPNLFVDVMSYLSLSVFYMMTRLMQCPMVRLEEFVFRHLGVGGGGGTRAGA